jgi:hypothetical protein
MLVESFSSKVESGCNKSRQTQDEPILRYQSIRINTESKNKNKILASGE